MSPLVSGGETWKPKLAALFALVRPSNDTSGSASDGTTGKLWTTVSSDGSAHGSSVRKSLGGPTLESGSKFSSSGLLSTGGRSAARTDTPYPAAANTPDTSATGVPATARD